MKFKIIKIYEKSNVLYVQTECKFGRNTFGYSPDKKFLDPLTNKPKYLTAAKMSLKKLYDLKIAKEKPIDKKDWGKEHTL